MKILITAVVASVLSMMLTMFVGVRYLIPEQDSARSTDASSEQLAALRHEIDSLAINQSQILQQLSASTHQLQSPTESDEVERNTLVSSARSTGFSTRAVDEGVELEHDKAQGTQVFEQLENQFYAEGYDGGWATEMQASLAAVEDRLHSLNLSDTQIVDQECRSNTCRVEFLHGEDSQDLIPSLLAAKGTRQLVLQRISDDYGERTIALYQR